VGWGESGALDAATRRSLLWNQHPYGTMGLSSRRAVESAPTLTWWKIVLISPADIFDALGSSITDLVVIALKALIATARRPILIALVTFIFVVVSTTFLILSAIVFAGWWQNFFLELGVGLLVAGLVDIAVLGALHSLIEGTEIAESIRKKVELESDFVLDELDRLEEQIKQVKADQIRVDKSEPTGRRPSGIGWPS
jgi:hypothetical protein